MKQLLFLFLFLLPCLAWAQYPSNGNQKITLGEQSTADGLVYRGLAADTNVITPFSDTSAYIILDTVNNRFFHYKINTNVWSVAGGGDTTSIAYVNTYGAQTVNGAKTLTSNLILKNSQEPSRAAIVTTQGFAADTTNWTRGTGWTFNGTQAVATAATGDLTYTPSLTVTSGNAYEITYTLTGYTAGTLTVAFGNVSLALPTQNATANVILLLPTIATGGFRFTTSSFTGNLDDITVVQISNPAPVLFAGQDDGSATLYSSLRMPNSTTFAFGGGAIYTTGSNNAAIGVNALRANTTGSNNVANGAGALLNNTTGDGNVANGQSALQNNTTGSENIANGVNALLNNTTGNLNVANGSSALRNNTTGSKNVANGVSALRGNTTGSNNIATGESALYNPSESLTGSDNIAIGAFAADNIRSTATRNVVIGSYLDLPVQDGSYQGVYQNALFITGASGTGTTIAGNVGIAVNTPTARLHLVAGTATASTAPLKFTSGVNLTTAEAGSMEFNGTNLFFSPSTTRHTVNHGLTGSATLNFPSTTTLLSADLTITVTGAADGDVVSLGVPNAAVNANTCYTAWVSTANTVTVRFNNYSSGTVDPASALFKVFVTK